MEKNVACVDWSLVIMLTASFKSAVRLLAALTMSPTPFDLLGACKMVSQCSFFPHSSSTFFPPQSQLLLLSILLRKEKPSGEAIHGFDVYQNSVWAPHTLVFPLCDLT